MEYSSFFKSIGADRQYSVDQFAEYFRSFLTNGIFNGGTELQVSSDEIDMTIDIAVGKAWMEGYYYSNSSIKPLTIEAADSVNPRIDRIVLRLNLNDDTRSISVQVIKGTPAASPVAPDLVRDLTTELKYDLSLAQVRVNVGDTTTKSTQITDERLNDNYCGIVNSLIELDTASLQAQWDSWFEGKTDEPGGEFYDEWKAWFDSVVGESYLTKDNADGYYGALSDVQNNANDISTLKKYGDIIEVTATGNILATYADKFLKCLNVITLTVQPNATIAFDVGTEITLFQYGTGKIIIAKGTAVEIRSVDDALALDAQYSAMTLKKIATDEWVLVGALA